MHDFHGWDMGAVREDIKFATKHCSDISKVAMVGEKTWEKWMSTNCKPFTMSSIRYFDAGALVQRVSVPFVLDLTHEPAAGYGTLQEAMFGELSGVALCPPNRHRRIFRYPEVGLPVSNRPSCT